MSDGPPLPGCKLEVERDGTRVHITLHLGDEYEAMQVYDTATQAVANGGFLLKFKVQEPV